MLQQLIYIIIGGLTGLLVFASADLPLIWRETAINTRTDIKEGSNYSSVKLLSTLIKAIAILIWVASLIAICYLIYKYAISYAVYDVGIDESFLPTPTDAPAPF
tara:strand:- start:50 stop:361 length:312 start_codon:yes stop_codon:yes gene_type:complete